MIWSTGTVKRIADGASDGLTEAHAACARSEPSVTGLALPRAQHAGYTAVAFASSADWVVCLLYMYEPSESGL